MSKVVRPKIVKTIIANRKGGVGKTTLSICMADAKYAVRALADCPDHVRRPFVKNDFIGLLGKVAEPECVLIDLDVQPGQEHSKSSLKRVFPEAKPYHVQPKTESVVADPKKAMGHFDKMGEYLVSDSPVLIDFGANVVDNFLNWCVVTDVGQDLAAANVQVRLVVPVTADDTAMEMAIDAIVRMREVCVPHEVDLRCFLALNGKEGPFEDYEGSPHWKKLLSLCAPPVSVSLIPVPRVDSELWPLMDQKGLSPSAVIAMTEDELADVFNMRGFAGTARRARNYLLGWFFMTVQEMEEKGLLGVAN